MPKCTVAWYRDTAPSSIELKECEKALRAFAEAIGDQGGVFELQHQHFAAPMGKCDTASLVVEINYGYSEDRAKIQMQAGTMLQKQLKSTINLENVHVRLKPVEGAVFIK